MLGRIPARSPPPERSRYVGEEGSSHAKENKDFESDGDKRKQVSFNYFMGYKPKE